MTVRKLDDQWVNNRDVAEILLIRILCKHAVRTLGEGKTFSGVEGWEDLTPQNTHVEFKINGVDVGEDLIATFNSLENDVNRMAKEQARSIISDKIIEFSNKIEKVTEKVTNAMDDVFYNIVEEHGLTKEEYED